MRTGRNCAVKSISRLLFGAMAVLGAAGCALAQEKAAPPQAQHAHPLQGAADWRERMQKSHSSDRWIEPTGATPDQGPGPYA
jgi:hypothetical protein